jgi:hypothetical protein
MALTSSCLACSSAVRSATRSSSSKVNCSNSEFVRYTMVNGRIYDARSMNQVGNHPRERGRFWWERD